jgi:hypothetical protein
MHRLCQLHNNIIEKIKPRKGKYLKSASKFPKHLLELIGQHYSPATHREFPWGIPKIS